MPSRRLRWALAAAVAATVAVAWLPDDEVAPPRAAASSRPRAAPTAAGAASAGVGAWPARPVRVAAARRDDPAPNALAAWGDPRGRSPAAVAAATATVSVAPAASGPPAPDCTLVGLVEDGGRVSALLLSGTATLVVGAGDAVDANWRVEAIAGRSVTLSTADRAHRTVLNFKPA